MSSQELITTESHHNQSETSNLLQQEQGGCKERCCKLSVSWPFNSKGTVIVLAWLPLFYSLFFPYVYFLTSLPYPQSDYIYYSVLVLVVLYYPVAGWLGDAYFGRYKVINFSIWVTWIMTIVSAAAVTLHRYVLSENETAHTIFTYAIYPALYAMLLGIPGGIFVNLFPFGSDQLQGASTQDLKSFVHWFAWAQIVSSYAVIRTSDSFYLSTNVLTKNPAILVAIPAICMTVMVCSNLILRKHFVIEPPSPNPLIKIYHVLRFAYRNKRPRQRSAFTYFEEGIPSRIDLAKTKYGGPQTHEQVENVKSFSRISVLMLVIGGISSGSIYGTVISRVNYHFKYPTDVSLTLQPLFLFLSILPIIIFVPFVELVLYKVKYRCFFLLTTLRRAGVGAVFMVISILGYLALDTTGHFITHGDVPCMLTANASSPTLDIDYRWLTVPAALNGMGLLFLSTAAWEFIAAQTPYGMKSILFGLLNTSSFVFGIPYVTLRLLFTSMHLPENKLSCGFWLFLSELIIILVAVSLFCIAAKKYKRRERDDIPNYHSFAENYYSTN